MAKFPPIERILFMDIETAPHYRSIEEIPEPLRVYWEERYERRRSPAEAEQEKDAYFLEKSGIHALYSRVVCIGLGYFRKVGGQWEWREEVLCDTDEKKLLETFRSVWEKFRSHAHQNLLPTFTAEPSFAICGHNIRNFDIPFLGRRLLSLAIPLPAFWREAQDAQPWQLKDPLLIDTMRLWNFTSSENSFISLELLAYALGIPFQKSIKHTDIRKAFYSWVDTGDSSLFQTVLEYCKRDVQVTAEIFIRMQIDSSAEKEKLIQSIKEKQNI
ncbi:MAG: ribonuclease H-like domain-containing protein [Bacteroidia bacterium]|nr:ribonuclease H-like domain-containing protein [Bacteroidia bacterium]